MSYTISYVTRVRLECDGCGKVAEFERRSANELPSGWRVFDFDLDQIHPPPEHEAPDGGSIQTLAACSRACLHEALLKRAQSAWPI